MCDFYSLPPGRANQMFQHALALAARGWATYPATNRKGPLKGSHGVKDATRDPDLLRELFGRPDVVLLAIVRLPMKPATASELKPAGVPI